MQILNLDLNANIKKQNKTKMQILNWQKSSFGFFCTTLQKNLDECFGQPNVSYYVNCK